MAYVIGLLTPQEATELERRGWELEEPPAALVDDETEERARRENRGGLRMVWVDAAMFDLLNCPTCCDGGTGEPAPAAEPTKPQGLGGIVLTKTLDYTKTTTSELLRYAANALSKGTSPQVMANVGHLLAGELNARAALLEAALEDATQEGGPCPYGSCDACDTLRDLKEIIDPSPTTPENTP